MVKGITRQVMVVKNPDGGLFEQAIFLLKEDSLEKQGITERQIIEEANRLSLESPEMAKRSRRSHLLQPLLWSGIGAGMTGLAWLLTMIIA